ncbi:uncharacterized protein BCR38DRAFT_439882 [Pseudomassariella vexata]|uniref:NDT80 domain-containing protein n=1 Tax=Pseudomassariella vexata TaxID=1141098 RepID=A0A1Y2DQD8_9PEZI|nr:uncharacterized protein BCR38DRAFT_439882 [Pseudomassariella vexata]ORY61326.1 hypothetical protein BCR38DRAFT_439882 [Pseudomassariella vexata]
MATFHAGLSSGTSPNDAMGLNVASMTGAGLGIEGFDQELTFDESMLDNVNGGLPIPFTSSYDFDTFSTTFEDPFNYSRPYEAAPDPETYQDEESSPQQLDDKLLGFSAPVLKATPLDDTTGTFSELSMTAELYGMFFVAEDVFGPGETSGRPLELTCYRRNLWQCSGQIMLPRHCTQVMDEQGCAVPIVEFYASISAIESIEGKTTEIISIPWKSSNGALGEVQETKTPQAPPKATLDLGGGQEVDGDRVSVPISWKRLQFKSATANNGRRKGLQQHYLVQINLLGKPKAGGDLMQIAEIHSGPVIVRGRSPRNFDSRKDVPLSADKKSGSVERTTNTRPQNEVSASPAPNMKQERTDPAQNLHRYHSLGNAQNSSGSSDWSTPAFGGQQGQQCQQHQSKKMAVSPNVNRPPVPSWGKESSSFTGKLPTLERHAKSSSSVPSLPINLSLSEDERSPNNRSNADALQSPQLNRSNAAQYGGSPSEETEQLYEYFPLSVDDWTPLVDTVYRPHIVHHIALPSEIKAQKVRSKAKRYFSAE